ncbi:MAG: hypothetical protein RR346_04165 [Bacteroidales bacterium]
MKQYLKVISIFLLSIILVETTGIKRIQHCCGSSEILLALSEMELLCADSTCEDVFEDHQNCEDHSCCDSKVPHEHHSECHWSCSHDAHHDCTQEKNDYCQDHTAPGFHKHHHDGRCVNADFLQLRPQQKQDNTLTQLLAFLPVEITIFDFEPKPVVIPLTNKYLFTIPKEAGRQKLALFSVFLI